MEYETRGVAKRDESHASPDRPRVLLAEDDEDLRSLIATTMRIDGIDVVEARDGSECLLALADASASASAQDQFDLIVSDVRMPGYSGVGVLASLRKWNASVPVILITAYCDPGLLALANKLGVTAVLTKPFELNALRSAIGHAVHLNGGGAGAPDEDDVSAGDPSSATTGVEHR